MVGSLSTRKLWKRFRFEFRNNYAIDNLFDESLLFLFFISFFLFFFFFFLHASCQLSGWWSARFDRFIGIQPARCVAREEPRHLLIHWNTTDKEHVSPPLSSAPPPPPLNHDLANWSTSLPGPVSNSPSDVEQSKRVDLSIFRGMNICHRISVAVRIEIFDRKVVSFWG